MGHWCLALTCLTSRFYIANQIYGQQSIQTHSNNFVSLLHGVSPVMIMMLRERSIDNRFNKAAAKTLNRAHDHDILPQLHRVTRRDNGPHLQDVWITSLVKSTSVVEDSQWLNTTRARA